jgi:hypothetical protein
MRKGVTTLGISTVLSRDLRRKEDIRQVYRLARRGMGINVIMSYDFKSNYGCVP